jgi:hypothetical protein
MHSSGEVAYSARKVAGYWLGMNGDLTCNRKHCHCADAYAAQAAVVAELPLHMVWRLQVHATHA